MFENQYIITDAPSEYLPQNFEEEIVGSLRIYHDTRLKFTQAIENNTKIAILGITYNPLRPEDTEQEIAHQLARTQTIDEALGLVTSLSGRYVLLFSFNNRVTILGDACHLRQIYFGTSGKQKYITSSQKLFLTLTKSALSTSEEKKAFIESPLHKKRFYVWYGEDTIDDRLKKLLPNHLLDVDNLSTSRFGPAPLEKISEREAIARAKDILVGSYAALHHRKYTLIQPITAGWDSRILLAASRPYRDNISYYVFASERLHKTDGIVAEQIAHRHHLQFTSIQPPERTPSFKAVYDAEHVMAYDLPNMDEVQYHYEQNYPPQIININGNATEIARCFYGRTCLGYPSLDCVLTLSGYGSVFPFITRAITNWYRQARKVSTQTGIPLLDLFYWEQRMGNWGSIRPFDQDIALEELSPFNNRQLLMLLLATPIKKRCAPDYRLFQDLIEAMWPEIFEAPINPDSSRLKNQIKSLTELRYLLLKIGALLKSIKGNPVHPSSE